MTGGAAGRCARQIPAARSSSTPRAFKTWAGDTAARMAWVVCSARMGKTVLCASVLDKLKSAVAASGMILPHFFFDERVDSYRTMLAQSMAQLRKCVETGWLNRSSARLSQTGC
ncbi:hypothetical protein ED733_000486 [Metarhizium rileyi]|uniref:Nephrocystin 3-like N-terminal domain-containing protein n=1 Tax=Metarhizium rileyi (strain RCEF 4871) TaxID=1649241 RepID=A0A5C6G1U9_METRR|nr:hypothetical protein ED733_000486 [Metarhizium rileyi]